MRLVFSGFLLALSPALSFAVTCAPAPAPGTVSSSDATAAPIFTKILAESAGCTNTIATLCPAVKNDMASLQPAVLNAAASNSACAVSGNAAGGGALSTTDVAWYKKRTAFWFALYSDMNAKNDEVNAGTYQISSSFQAQFLDAVPAAAAVAVAPAPVVAAPAPAPAGSRLCTPGAAAKNPDGETCFNELRISGGIDVSAAASVDPAAKFLLEGAFQTAPLPAPYKLDSHLWGGGYIRLASIAQPGAISGISNVGTYVKPLTDSSPAQLVQSAEGSLDLEWHFKNSKKPSLSGQHQPALFSAIANAGIITPLSQSQADPTIYIVSQQLYNFYTQPDSDSVAMNAIKAACGSSYDSSNACYVAYLPQDRTRFYRNYAAGVTYKKYYYNANEDSFGFPGIATLTIGQNEYVTRGQLRGLVLHAGASWPLAGNFPTGSLKWAGAIYVYGALDMNLNGKNQNTQEYLLQTAGSSVTLASDRLAAFSVKQEDRDRYRFGIGIDILKLFNK